ncbi:MAG TPA: hypothetical protein VE733_00015 [Streptosporangiaceae bacterium]|jgi:hypothetical protein|nr:hypothetical protein [Streptosporangiaceae bacterium]
MTPEEMRKESERKQKALAGLVNALKAEKGAPAAIPRLPLWPGGGFAPAKPRPGARAEVQLTGTKGRTGSGGWSIREKNQAIVLITWPGGSTTRTVKGNFTIRAVMEWCAAFNQISGT